MLTHLFAGIGSQGARYLSVRFDRGCAKLDIACRVRELWDCFQGKWGQLAGERSKSGGGRETSKRFSTGDFELTDATILLVEVVSSEVRGRKQMLLGVAIELFLPVGVKDMVRV